jgi:hypothetical protein
MLSARAEAPTSKTSPWKFEVWRNGIRAAWSCREKMVPVALVLSNQYSKKGRPG